MKLSTQNIIGLAVGQVDFWYHTVTFGYSKCYSVKIHFYDKKKGHTIPQDYQAHYSSLKQPGANIWGSHFYHKQNILQTITDIFTVTVIWLLTK